MAIVPADIPTGTVTGNFYFVNEDNVDADTLPDLTIVSGTVNFTCSVAAIRMPGKLATVIPVHFNAKFDNTGTLVPVNGDGTGIALPATDSAVLNPTGFTWRVDFNLVYTDSKHTVNIPSFNIQVPAGQTIDLTTAMPVSTSPGVLTVQGPSGGTIPVWAPLTQYAAGEKVISPSNDIVSANIAHTSGTAYTTANWSVGKVAKGELVINASDYAKCDGTTDDSAAILNAANSAATFGAALFLPAGKTIGLASKITLPAGLVAYTNGTKFKGLTESGDFLLALSSSTTVHGCLWVETVTGGTNVRGISITGQSNITLDAVRVESPAPGAGVGDSYDCALAVTGVSDNIRIGSVTVKNFDYPVKFDGCSRIKIGVIDITSYVRGVYINDTTDMFIEYGLIRTTSPNASATPGHNGVLINGSALDSTSGLRLNNVAVRDSGEHAFRIGGDFRVSKVWFNDCSAVNAGVCGFKVLGGTIADNNYHENIFFNSCLVEDAGQVDDASAGFMLQFVRGVEVNNPIIRKKNKTYSVGVGFNIQAADTVSINNPIVKDTLVACYEVSPVLGNCTNVKLNGGILESATGDGILINYTGRTFRRVAVEGWPQLGISGTGHNVNIISGGTGTITGGSWITWQSVSNSTNQIDPAAIAAAYFFDARAPLQNTPVPKNGSKWIDNVTGAIWFTSGGTWKTPTLA